MTQTETRELLQRLGMTPTKALGQNYLVDENLAKWIVRQLDLQPGDHVVEVGPGLGSLTEVVLEHEANVTMTLIEFDRKSAAYWREHPQRDRLEVIEANAVKVDWTRFVTRRPVKFLSNLPYKAGALILGNAAEKPWIFKRFVVTLQKEVATRIVAEPGSKDIGPLSLVLGRGWQAKLVKTLPPEVFWPKPDVVSATLVLEPRQLGALPQCYADAFSQLVHEAFAQRRKKLRNLVPDDLRKIWPTACAAVGVAEDIRAEQLTLEQWITLTNLWRPSPELPAQDVHGERFDVVDECNRIIGGDSRHEVHRQRLRHRAVHVYVTTQQGDGPVQLLLQKRSHLKDKAAGKWDSSATGHVDAGEDYQSCAVREVAEELGITGEPQWIAGIQDCEETGQEFLGVFELRVGGQQVGSYPLSEIETLEWVPIEVVRSWMSAVPGDFAQGFLCSFQTVYGSAKI